MVRLLIICAVLTTCSVEKEVSKLPEPASPKFEALKPTLATYCLPCHNGEKHPLDFSSEEIFAKSKAKLRVENGSMPPGKPLEAEAKEKFAAYYR